MKHRFLIIFFVVACLLFTAGCGRGKDSVELALDEQSVSRSDPDREGDAESVDEEPETDVTESVFVYVCGKVRHAGVYELPASARVCDAIDAAGGVRKNADAESLNQAEPLTDGMRIYIPSRKETASSSGPEASGQNMEGNPTSVSASGSSSGLVNLNTAAKEELMTLPGIGESKAQSIMDYRQETGSFARIEDIMNISGIKEGVFNKIKDQITV